MLPIYCLFLYTLSFNKNLNEPIEYLYKGFTDVHIAHMLTYLKLSKYKIGLLINFNVASLKNGIKRLIH